MLRCTRTPNDTEDTYRRLLYTVVNTAMLIYTVWSDCTARYIIRRCPARCSMHSTHYQVCAVSSQCNVTATTLMSPITSQLVLLLPRPRRLCFRRCLSVCLFATLHKNFRMDVHEMFMEGWQCPVNKRLNFGGDPDHRSGSRSVS